MTPEQWANFRAWQGYHSETKRLNREKILLPFIYVLGGPNVNINRDLGSIMAHKRYYTTVWREGA